MANRSLKSSFRFGKAGGKHSKMRKWIYKHKPYKCRVDKQKHNNSLKIKIFRENILKKYKIKSKTKSKQFKELFNHDNDLYSIQRVSNDSSLKFSIKRVNVENADGYRLFNLSKLQLLINTITRHALGCKSLKKIPHNVTPVKLISEVKTSGLASVLLCKCEGCYEEFKFDTSPQLPINNTRHYDVNIRSVWGTMVTGSGVSNLNEFMGTLNSPGMSQPTFSKIEQEIGDLWGNCVEEDLLSAGVEERRIAIEKGNYDEGVPCITVIADGGWSKRAHKHTYNALGGVGVIFGAETGKVLHIGVRNKHCYICNKSETSHTTPPPHRCFRNWSQSSQAMEADIIVDGFMKAEQVHGLRYTTLIADGDSSVFPKIQENVPVWGKRVKKMECANHVSKCLRTSLEKLVEENNYYKGKGKLSKSARVKIVSAVRCAIRIRSLEPDKTTAARKLEYDIRNSVHHVFGDHSKCSDFCKAKDEKRNKITDTTLEIDENLTLSDENIPEVIENVSEIWKETTDLESQEQSRGDCDILGNLDNMMVRDISCLLDRTALKSRKLIGNSTTNLAESWMAIRCKFDGGKLYNRCNRGSWHSRCYGGCLRKNLGPQWSTKVFEKTTCTKAGKYFEHLYETRDIALKATTLAQAKPQRKCRRWKRKMQGVAESTSKKAKKEYGQQSLESPPDVNEEKLQELKQAYTKTHINLSDTQLNSIEVITRKQSSDLVWKEERRKRITSSNFGLICKRNPNIKVKNLVKSLLYSSFRGNTYTRKGLQNETMTIREYTDKKKEENCPVSVIKMGLFVCRENRYLAASPDGKVIEESGEVGLIEVKNLLQNKPINLYEAARTPNFCLECINGKLKLKENHNFYFQVQGQVNVTNLPWVDFVVRTENPYQLHVERIYKDQSFWNIQMLPKLRNFYFKVLLPELTVPLFNTLAGIREPGNWYTEVSHSTDETTDVNIKPKSRQKKTVHHSLTNKAATGTSKGTPKIDKGVSSQTSDRQLANSSSNIRKRPQRAAKVKFLGRRISHEWVEDEDKGVSKWYTGTVTNTISGKDGDKDTVYEVLYDGDDEAFSIDHLYEDYQSSSLKFIDL